MKGLFFALWTGLSILHLIRAEQTLHMNSTLSVKQSVAWEYYQISPTDSPAEVTLLEVLIDPLTPVSALLCHRQKSPPLYLTSSHYLIADAADYEAWFSQKPQHSLSLLPSVMETGTTVGVFLNFTTRREIAYQIRLRGAGRRECAFGCSGNGKCNGSGACICSPRFTASDCSLPSRLLTLSAPLQLPVTASAWTYLTMNLTDDPYELHVNWSGGAVELLTKRQFGGLSTLPSEAEYTKKYTAESPLAISFQDKSAQTWHLSIRSLPPSDNMTLSVSLKSNRDSSNRRIIWGLTVTSTAAFLLICSLFAYKYCQYRKRRSAFAYATQHSTCMGIPLSLLDLHFPMRKYESPSETQCSVCSGKVSGDCEVRELLCGHILHAECAVTWFQSSTTCSTCRKDFAGILDTPGDLKAEPSLNETFSAEQTSQSETLSDLQPRKAGKVQPGELFSFRS